MTTAHVHPARLASRPAQASQPLASEILCSFFYVLSVAWRINLIAEGDLHRRRARKSRDCELGNGCDE
jgi:hypothetical protein